MHQIGMFAVPPVPRIPHMSIRYKQTDMSELRCFTLLTNPSKKNALCIMSIPLSGQPDSLRMVVAQATTSIPGRILLNFFP